MILDTSVVIAAIQRELPVVAHCRGLQESVETLLLLLDPDVVPVDALAERERMPLAGACIRSSDGEWMQQIAHSIDRLHGVQLPASIQQWIADLQATNHAAMAEVFRKEHIAAIAKGSLSDQGITEGRLELAAGHRADLDEHLCAVHHLMVCRDFLGRSYSDSRLQGSELTLWVVAAMASKLARAFNQQLRAST